MEHYIFYKFHHSILERTVFLQLLWGKDPIEDKNMIYEIAKQEYENFKDKLPVSYLESYNPNIE